MLKLFKNIDLFSNEKIKNLLCSPAQHCFCGRDELIESVFKYPQQTKLRILEVCASNFGFFFESLEYAVETLDVDAVKHLNTHAPQSTTSLSSAYALKSLLQDNKEKTAYKTHKELPKAEIKSRSIEILKTVITNKVFIDHTEALSVLSSLISYDEFMNWVTENKINLWQGFYNNYYNSAPYLEVHSPLHPIKTGTQKGQKLNKIDVLLSRTNSNGVDSAKIINVYDNLLNNNNKEVRDLMSMLLINIANGDTVRIIFTKDGASAYDMNNNIISVSLVESDAVKIYAIAIHEIAHYVLQKMFHSNALPFSLDNILYNYLGEIYATKFNTELEFIESSLISNIKHLTNTPKAIQKHQEAVKQTVLHAASLLQINTTELQALDSVQDTSEYLKNYSPIDLGSVEKHQKFM